MLFHTTEAWNLAEAMYTDGKMGLSPDSYIRGQFELGHEQGWIRPDIRQSSLDMFVFTDRVYLPPDLDIRTPGEQHMAWRLESWKSDDMPYDPDTLIKLLDYIAPQLMFRGVVETPAEVLKIANRWQKQVAETGNYRDTGPVEHAVWRELMMAQRSVRFAEDHV